MAFNSFEFAFFLIIVYFVYRVLSFKLQNIFLLCASYFFYGWWSYQLLVLIILTSVVDYTCGLLISEGKLATRERVAPPALLIAAAFFGDVVNWKAIDLASFSVNWGSLLPPFGPGWYVLLAVVCFVLFFNAIYRFLVEIPVKKRNKIILVSSIIINLGVLGCFKYFDFFASSAESLLNSIGIPVPRYVLNLLLPIGISFYTFETMTYTIDIYRGIMKPTHRFTVFALFLCFFPRLVAGPIVRSRDLIPQFSQPRKITYEQTTRGLYLILLGFFKKLVLADGLAVCVTSVYSSTGIVSWLDVVVATVFFAFQIYCDFSGYSDISRGVGKLFGIELTVNFNLPYFSRSPGEFWRRWHISLSSWLRDYLYISLGGNKKGKVRTYLNLVLTMTLGGLWHGAAWNYVLWGVYQGVIQAVYKLIGIQTNEKHEDRTKYKPLVNVLLMVLCFLVTCYGWMLFRATSLEQVMNFTAILFRGYEGLALTMAAPSLAASVGLVVLLVYEVLEYRFKSTRFYDTFPIVARGFLFATFTILILMGASNAPAQFIYFKF